MLTIKQYLNILAGITLLAFNLFMKYEGEITMTLILSALLLIKVFKFLENL